jgi:hypothetical protein
MQRSGREQTAEHCHHAGYYLIVPQDLISALSSQFSPLGAINHGPLSFYPHPLPMPSNMQTQPRPAHPESHLPFTSASFPPVCPCLGSEPPSIYPVRKLTVGMLPFQAPKLPADKPCQLTTTLTLPLLFIYRKTQVSANISHSETAPIPSPH